MSSLEPRWLVGPGPVTVLALLPWLAALVARRVGHRALAPAAALAWVALGAIYLSRGEVLGPLALFVGPVWWPAAAAAALAASLSGRPTFTWAWAATVFVAGDATLASLAVGGAAVGLSAGRRRLLALLGAAIMTGASAWSLGPDGVDASLRVVVQMRFLGAWVAGALLLGAATARRDHLAPLGVVLGLVLVAFGQAVAPRCADTLRLAAPVLAWVGAGLPWLGLLTRRPVLMAGSAALGVGLLGLLSGTSAGVAAAGLAAAGLVGALFVATRPTPAQRAWPHRLLVAAGLGAPGGPGFVAALLALSALTFATGPASVGLGPVALAAGGLAVGTGWSLVGKAAPAADRRAWALLALLASLGIAGLAWPGAARTLARPLAVTLSSPTLPPDDVGGHRRLWRQAHRPTAPRDAGP